MKYLISGIRVIPEFDSPAHVGFGWRLPGWENYTVCVDHQPWEEKCVEPPCGQVYNSRSPKQKYIAVLNCINMFLKGT